MLNHYSVQFREGLPSLTADKSSYCQIESIHCAEDVFRVCKSSLNLHLYTDEFVYAFALNAKNRIIGIFEIGHGTFDQCLLSPRDILIRMLLIGACFFILVHNHPSQDPSPSNEDKRATERIHEAANLIGIKMLDHIIITDKKYTSLISLNGSKSNIFN